MRPKFVLLYGLISTLSVVLLLSVWGCGPTSTEQIQRELIEQVEAADGSNIEVIDSLYGRHDYRPVWVTVDEPTDLADSLMQAASNVDEHALSSDVYGIAALQDSVRETFDRDPLRDSLYYQKLAELELEFSRLLVQYVDDLLNGRSKQQEVTDTWHLERRGYPLLPVLQQIVREEDMSVLERHVSTDEGYEQLRGAFNRYREIVQRGGWPNISEGPDLGTGSTGPRVHTLEKRLRSTGDLPEDAEVDSTFDTETVRAVEVFQQRHGLEATGTVGEKELRALNVPAEARVRQLAVNLERRRWLPVALAGSRLTVNVPDFRLSVYEEDQQVMEMPVIVGRRLNETPVFADTLSYVVLRPYWYVPTSIATEEILPQMVEDDEYLEEQRYEIVTGNREIVPEDSIEAADREELETKLKSREWIVREKPGPTNALGNIKFMFPNAHSIYLHDTPADHLFSREELMFSHGCIRVQRPVELADYVLGSEWDSSRIRDAFEKEDEPERVEAARSIPVYILYLTAWVDGEEHVNFRNDIYDHDPLLWEAIEGSKIGDRPVVSRGGSERDLT